MTRILTALTLGLCVLSKSCVRAAPSKNAPLNKRATAARPPMTINHLRCEDVMQPLGIETQAPRLSWQLDSDLRGARQATYQIWVASKPELLGSGKADLWDSGQVKSADSTQIAYNGKPMLSNQMCFWKVRVWMPDGQSAQSESASWQMGLLREADWHGGWLGYSGDKATAADDRVPSLEGASWVWFPEATGDPKVAAPVATRWFRQKFDVSARQKAAIQNAMLRVAADNKATIYFNGREVGRAENSWKKREAIDVTRAVKVGANVIALAVSNESDTAADVPNPAGVAAQWVSTLNDGAKLTINSDADWKTSDSAPQNWQDLDFNDDNWRAVQVLAKAGQGPWGEINNNATVSGLPAPYLRRTFEIGGVVKRATAYICGLGYYEMSLNGRKVGDHVLDPGWTRYDRRSLYVAHDVTPYLKTGANALGVVLGTGHFDDHVLAVWDFDNASWRARPKMKLEMRVEYGDGRVQTVSSDGQWKAANGPITFDSISSGERYDARLEMPGWDTALYDDSKWANAQTVEPVKGALSAQIAPAIKITETITPVKVTQPSLGVFIVDLGQNIAGVPQLRAQGAAGAQVSMRCAEQLTPDGNLDASSIDVFLRRRDPNAIFQTDFYTLKGGGATETWNPNFTYHGFRYIEVKGFPGTPTIDNFRGLVMHSAFDEAGQFSCSNPLLNAIQRIAHWSYRNNWHSIPTDCPQREKNGWTADAHLAAEMGLTNFDGAANYRKWLRDIADEQRDDGSYSAIIPTSGWGYNIGPAWDSAYPLIAWYLYQYRGDETVIREHYPRFAKYLDYLSSRSKEGLVDYGLGDWLPAKTQTPNTLTSTSYYYADAVLLSKMAGLLGKPEDALKYSELAARIKTAFNAKFYDAQTGKYDNGSITAQSCALYQGLVEEANKPAVFAALLAAIERQDYHMDVGILGAKYVLNTLADNGRADVAYRMLQTRTMPSYGYWIDKGATTMWERWSDEGNNDDSRDHVMFGDVSAWFYKYLAGIQIASPGFQTFKLEPHVVGDLTAARATHDTVYGTITSDWKIENGQFRWQVTVPPNTAATATMPFAAAANKITEAGQPLAKSQGVSAPGDNNGVAIFKIEPGTYLFACAMPKSK